jgi:large subunit ribosomal protein L5
MSKKSPKTLKERYTEVIVPQLMKDLDLNNVYQAPKLLKVVVNVGLGDANQNAKALDAGIEELRLMTGQQPRITRAKKSIAGFKIRENMPIGAMVTLRGERMYEFVTKLTDIVIPRIRDFRGLSEKGFDGRGNYNLGLKDQLVFPEIEYDNIFRARGMNITLVTTARNDVEAKAFMAALGFPFRKVKVQPPKDTNTDPQEAA